MSVKNLDAAKSLVKRYRSISTEVLKQALEDYEIEEVMECLTGFGSFSTCCLCKAIGRTAYSGNCEFCIHSVYGTGSSIACIDHETYSDIHEAENVQELYAAIQNRADYIESLIKFVENGN